MGYHALLSCPGPFNVFAPTADAFQSQNRKIGAVVYQRASLFLSLMILIFTKINHFPVSRYNNIFLVSRDYYYFSRQILILRILLKVLG